MHVKFRALGNFALQSLNSQSLVFLCDRAVDNAKNLTKGQAYGFMGPYLPRRVAQAAWGYSASGCLSSAVACVVCKPLGRVSLAAHADEQRREQAEVRVSCSLPSFLWTSIRKNGRLKAK